MFRTARNFFGFFVRNCKQNKLDEVCLLCAHVFLREVGIFYCRLATTSALLISFGKFWPAIP
ncbi:hypothetical protein DSUL_50111 [Desulfovibrionales bacterium]